MESKTNMTKTTLIGSMKRIVNQRGNEALERAKIDLRSSFSSNDSISVALRYFADTTMKGVLPVFPALISLSCEAVGGKTEKTISMGAAISLIAGAADIHDDVIDESSLKGSKRTVFGKFGKEIAVLAGDVMLTHGLVRFQDECEWIPEEQRDRILLLLQKAILEIGRAEALETRMRAMGDASPEAYFKIIDLKSVVPEMNMKIGAILGNGSEENIEKLGHFGRIFGTVSTVTEEFMDMEEHQELRNRLLNKCLPLPYLFALQNSSLRTKILLSGRGPLSKARLNELQGEVLNSQEAKELTKKMNKLVQDELEELASDIEKSKAREELQVLLASSLEMLLGMRS